MLDSDTLDCNPVEKENILKQVQAIDKILEGMDKNSLESRKVRQYLQKHYHFEKDRNGDE
jgi:hypothetical protein